MGKIDWISAIGGIILIIGGIFAFANPLATFTTIAAMLGIIAIIRGIMFILDYLKTKESNRFKANYMLIIAIFLIILGIIFLLRPSFFMSIFAYAVAIWFILDAVQGLVNSGIYRLLSSRIYAFNIVLNLLLLIAGIILLFNPMITWISVPFLIGFSLLVVGLIYVVYGFVGKSR